MCRAIGLLLREGQDQARERMQAESAALADGHIDQAVKVLLTPVSRTAHQDTAVPTVGSSPARAASALSGQ
jgi:hypothetical protein